MPNFLHLPDYPQSESSLPRIFFPAVSTSVDYCQLRLQYAGIADVGAFDAARRRYPCCHGQHYLRWTGCSYSDQWRGGDVDEWGDALMTFPWKGARDHFVADSMP